MLMIFKFEKSIADGTKHLRGPYAPRGPRVWDPWLEGNVNSTMPGAGFVS